MNPSKIKIAAIQMASSPNVNANLLEAEKLLAEAAGKGVRLALLPENFAFMGKSDNELGGIAEADGEGPLQHFLSQMARRYGIWLVGGTIPLLADDAKRVRSACLVFDDQGRRTGRYDKIHLFDVSLPESGEKYEESSAIEPGNQVVSLNTPFGRLGLAICYDLRFPELFRNLVDQGVEIFCLPAAFTALTGKAHWEILLRARAIENLSYVVAAAQGGFHISGRETYGNSMIIDPWGAVLARAPTGAGFVIAEIDPDFLATTRRTFPTLDHRYLECGASH
ncbi:MAG: carbon-nitrogen hydrolase family protein [Gammaproteobacteria bacterium]|nr:carbon-nitrogen hydrolase family protein [Gammaproteobacteria bacterium]MBU1653943.1 carbon-nitrogen hydrolase family protein [Gammaproteobacteria bacterium]MBU1962643.1 carbon-nitrogen hydrolase family protein [Gammaproteobacteria bacterium]